MPCFFSSPSKHSRQKDFPAMRKKNVIKINGTMGNNIGKFLWLHTSSPLHIFRWCCSAGNGEKLFIAINISEIYDYDFSATAHEHVAGSLSGMMRSLSNHNLEIGQIVIKWIFPRFITTSSHLQPLKWNRMKSVKKFHLKKKVAEKS